MKKYISVLLVLSILLLTMSSCGNNVANNENSACDGGDRNFGNMKEEIYIGENAIGDYSIVYTGSGAKDAAETLQTYIKRTCGKELSLEKGKGTDKFISVSVVKNGEEEPIRIENGNVYISGPTLTYVLDKTFVFINTYLGWMHAGAVNECISDEKRILHIPETVIEKQAWIEEREAIVTLWNTSLVRGDSYKENTSTLTDILTYSDSQLYEYVKMLKWCGYTGVQVTDICAAWTATSGYEFVHDRIRTMADAAHSLDMNFTLWVWAANFDGFGWVDDEVTYDKGSYDFQYQNPEVVACFEKYYGIYAELADVCDRVITHFYDPGNLETADDVGYFAKLLKDKMQSVNPGIDFGISCWIDAFDLGVILSYTGADVTVYEGNCMADGGIDGDLRERTYKFAARLGTWSWNTSHMEIDQITAMQYQPAIIKETYQYMRQYDDIMKPGYWSEMDSYHLLDAFSLYCAGALLQNPDMGLYELTGEVALSAVGPDYADSFARVLSLLEKARSGDSWDTFWWKSDNYVLASDDYPSDEILREVDECIIDVEQMISDDIEGYYMPTPFSMKDILKLILPQLKQIKEYATFRSSFDALKADVAAGNISSDEAAIILYQISYPVREYNAIIGTWGQPEARQQRILVLDFCEEFGIEVPIYETYDRMRKERIYNSLCAQQKGKKEAVQTWTYSAQCAYHTEERRLIDELIEEGLFTATEGVWYYLTDWEDYIYDFNN